MPVSVGTNNMNITLTTQDARNLVRQHFKLGQDVGVEIVGAIAPTPMPTLVPGDRPTIDEDIISPVFRKFYGTGNKIGQIKELREAFNRIGIYLGLAASKSMVESLYTIR